MADASGGVRFARTLPAVALATLSVGAWILTRELSEPGMRTGMLTASEGPGAMSMGSDTMAPSVGGAVGFVGMWSVMMAAMMWPSAVPVVTAFDRWLARAGEPRSRTILFAAGYHVIWTLSGAMAFVATVAIAAWAPADPSSRIRAGALVLIAGGLYQVTPLKRVCLRNCRSPLGVLTRYGRRLTSGAWGPFETGLRQGLYCVGCCWALMFVLVMLGTMNLVWMAIGSVVILVEKVVTAGDTLSSLIGIAVIAAGAILVTFPTRLPMFG